MVARSVPCCGRERRCSVVSPIKSLGCGSSCATLPRMRPLLKYRTPAQLLWMIGAANALVSLSFGVHGVVSRRYPHGQHRPLPTVLFSFGALILGLIGTLIAESSLRNGTKSERWPDALLDAPRKVVAHAAFSILPSLLIMSSFCGHHLFAQREFGRSLDVSLSGDEPHARDQRLTSTTDKC